jgi:hypothetical protein
MGRHIDCTYCGRRVYWVPERRRAYELRSVILHDDRAREEAGEGPPKPTPHICPRRPAPAPVRSRQASPEEAERIRRGLSPRPMES